MRVLVTGGSGFIGSHVVDKLRDAGHQPVIFDLCPSARHPSERIDTVVGDLFDTAALREAMGGCDAVIHLAAAADVGIVAEKPEESEEVNAHGTLAVLESARASGVGRVIYGSTIWAYGESGDGVIDEETLLGLPKHVYTASKVAGEMYCTSYAELYGVDYTILRFGIPYGPRARPAAVIPAFVRKALTGEPLTIAGDGSQGRGFVYVEDLAEGVVRALRPAAVNRIYNLASDTTVTIRELATTVQELVADVEIVHTPGRDGDFAGAEISSRRAAQELDWRAVTPLREGVRRYIEWLQADSAPEPAPASPEPVGPPASLRQPVRKAVRQHPAWRAPFGFPRSQLHRLSGLFENAQSLAFASVIGTLIAYATALRMSRFDEAQTHAVGVTTVIATMTVLLLVQAASVRRFRVGLTGALWLIAAYLGVLILRWPRHALELAVPQAKSLLLSGIGALIALVIAVGITRWRRESATSDEII
jgi:UDP-glucose 4-epimerase